MTLKELGHHVQKTQVHCDNATAVGITNNTVKCQHSCLMEMQYFWVCDKVAQDAYDVKWHLGQENIAYYQSKHHIGAHPQAIQPCYLHNSNSSLVLPWATRPSTLKGCVGTLPAGYICNVSLPRVPWVHSAQSHQVHKIPDYCEDPYVVHTFSSPCSIDERATFVFSPTWHAIAINN